MIIQQIKQRFKNFNQCNLFDYNGNQEAFI